MEERKEETVFSICVDWENRVISFSEETGVEEVLIPAQDDMLKFANERGNEGFEIN